MSVVGEFTVSAEAFALADSLSAAPSLTVEFDRIVAHSTEWVMPFLWVSGPESEFDAFDAALADDPTVRSAEVTDAFSDVRLYEVTWDRDVTRTVDLVLDHEGTILEATGQTDAWQLNVRFASREQLATFHAHFEDSGEVELTQLISPTEPYSGTFDLTAKQRDALVAAYEAGYFDSPRAVTASALAEEFGVSQQAFSERLHRGTAQLVESALLTG